MDSWCFILHFSIIIYGTPKGSFPASRGLRQGNSFPVSYFLLVADSFNQLFSKGEKKIILRFRIGSKIVKFHIFISQWHFKFLEERETSSNNFKTLINCFKLVSGLKVNRGKIPLLGLIQIKILLLLICKCHRMWNWIFGQCNIWGFLWEGSKAFWKPVIERYKQKLTLWKAKKLSFGVALPWYKPLFLIWRILSYPYSRYQKVL